MVLINNLLVYSLKDQVLFPLKLMSTLELGIDLFPKREIHTILQKYQSKSDSFFLYFFF